MPARLDLEGPAPGPREFVGARSNKDCKAQTAEVATYIQRGEIWISGREDAVGASWRTKLGGKRSEQVAFSSFDVEGRPVSRPRGLGFSDQEAPARVFSIGDGWAMTWFDGKGLAYARPKVDPMAVPEIGHLGTVSSQLSDDVALASSTHDGMGGAVVAVAPFGKDGGQLGLFLFAPNDEGAQAVKALAVTHHAKKPRHPAIAADASGFFVAWHEDGKLVASHFDTKGKESEACAIAPAAKDARERLALAATPSGAIALWSEKGAIRARALDKNACPTSPIWSVAEGKLPSLAGFGDGALVAWVASDGRLLAVKLAPNGAPPAKGVDVAEGSTGLSGTPAVTAMGSRAAFCWAEAMSPVISTRRLQLRIVDGACFP